VRYTHHLEIAVWPEWHFLKRISSLFLKGFSRKGVFHKKSFKVNLLCLTLLQEVPFQSGPYFSHSVLDKLPSTSTSLGYCSYRSWICSTIGAICPWSQPQPLRCLRVRIGAELDVVGRAETAVGHLHDGGLGVGRRDSGFLLVVGLLQTS
jgi:hypothetical protein